MGSQDLLPFFLVDVLITDFGFPRTNQVWDRGFYASGFSVQVLKDLVENPFGVMHI